MMPRRANITDRALRYRAVKNHPPGEKRCAFCGAKRQIQVGHVDGHEENGDAANLIWTCRSCNQLASNSLRRAGLGRLTHQYNPSGGAKTLGAWLSAVSVVTPHKDRGQASLFPQAGNEMSIRDAVQLIRDTPASRRSSFAREIAERKRSRARYNPCKRKNIWPFPDKRLSPRQTTPASGGILAHMGKGSHTPRASKRKGGAVQYKGYSLKPIAEGGYFAIDSEFDTLRDAKRFIDSVVKGRGNSAGRKNPAAASAQAYEDFHGKPSTETVTVSKRIHHHTHLAAAGDLRRLKVASIDGKHVVTIRFAKGTKLAFNEDRNQLFVEGGDQSVNLRDFGISRPHELETLGQVTDVEYFTTKDHLGAEGGTAIYQHTFRTTNEDGKHVTLRTARCPDLIYRTRDEQLEFSGGSYEILPEGIDR